MLAVRSAILAVAASEAPFFSYLLLLHQQASLLYKASSSSCSAFKVFDISFNRFTTRVTGVSPFALTKLPVSWLLYVCRSERSCSAPTEPRESACDATARDRRRTIFPAIFSTCFNVGFQIKSETIVSQ